MTLLDFDVELPAPVRVPVKVADQEVGSAMIMRNATAWVATVDTDWTWSELRDYVVSEIESRQGPQPRNLIKESAIFKSFMARQPQATQIARYAFGFCDGLWNDEPITVNRFCRGADPYFSIPILERLG